jgi:hypothetical protein
MLAWAPVLAFRFLALLVLVAALLAVQATFGGAPAVSDRIELPSNSDDGGSGGDDGDDVPGFTLEISSVARPIRTGCSFLDTHRAPAPSPAVSRIFRPPISPLA